MNKYKTIRIQNAEKEEIMAQKKDSLLYIDENQKQVGMPEFIWYLVAVFFYTNMTGMVGAFRNAYLVNVLRVTSDPSDLPDHFNPS